MSPDVVHLIVLCWALVLRSFRDWSHYVAHKNICSWLRRDSCVEVKSLSVPLCASLPATKHIKLPRPLQFEVFCFHIASHGALVRHFSGMNTAGWSHGTPNEDFGCITSHEQSTRCSFYSGLLGVLVATKKSFRAEQIVRTRLPTEIFAHACVEINSKSTLFVCIP